jgi:hypothetical protein
MAHSGYPYKGINALELAYDALQHIEHEFYLRFPQYDICFPPMLPPVFFFIRSLFFNRHPKEVEYGFPCQSSMKATNVICPEGSLNQIRGSCTIQGDIRMVPFYKVAIMGCNSSNEALESHLSFVYLLFPRLRMLWHSLIKWLLSSTGRCHCANMKFRGLLIRSPSQLQLPCPQDPRTVQIRVSYSVDQSSGWQARQQGHSGDEVAWVNALMRIEFTIRAQKRLLLLYECSGECDGLAADITSSGFKYLADATKRIVGQLQTEAGTGTLPLVAELQQFGWDVQVIGYGKHSIIPLCTAWFSYWCFQVWKMPTIWTTSTHASLTSSKASRSCWR